MADRDLKNREFVGRGLHFPLRVDSHGRLALTRGASEVEESIRVILETAPGERVMRPEFGCRVWELLFDPRNAATEAAVVEYVQDALKMWEPRIDVLSVTLVDDPNLDDSVMLVQIQYRIKRTHDERSIVFPFYIMDEPAE
ncbi:MAG: GPW/gp25 family protein [Caldilineaceae bacterium]|nr:GPW/gp25 family protein [Caldilineaceae bacterium]